MGWLYLSAAHMSGHNTPKAYLDAQFTYPPDPYNGRDHGLRILASSAQLTTYYAAAERYTESETQEIFAIVCLTRFNRRNKEGLIFGYKDMTEHMGPCESACPRHILDLLTPTTHEYALDWRARCNARLALTERRKPADGDILMLDGEMRFSDGIHERRFFVERSGANIVLRRSDGVRCRISRLMERKWTLIPKPSRRVAA
jgi:hypothetical protein